MEDARSTHIACHVAKLWQLKSKFIWRYLPHGKHAMLIFFQLSFFLLIHILLFLSYQKIFISTHMAHNVWQWKSNFSAIFVALYTLSECCFRCDDSTIVHCDLQTSAQQKKNSFFLLLAMIFFSTPNVNVFSPKHPRTATYSVAMLNLRKCDYMR